MNVYAQCPTLIGPRFTLRPVEMADADALLRVYSDEKAQPFFNADNCTSDFSYTTLKEMQDCIAMWQWSYAQGHFVRWTICDTLCRDLPVGTVEMFRRPSQDAFDGCGVLRIDLLSRYEYRDTVYELISTLLPEMYDLFGVDAVITKATEEMQQRRQALAVHRFYPARELLIGHGGREYGDYWIKQRPEG